MGALILEYPITTEESNLIKISQKNPLTEIERKIVLTIASMVNSADEEDKVYALSIQEFYDMLGIQGTDSNLQFEKIIDDLLSKVVEIPREDGGWVFTHWLSSAQYIKDSEVVRIRLSSDLKPYFLHLKTFLLP